MNQIISEAPAQSVTFEKFRHKQISEYIRIKNYTNEYILYILITNLTQTNVRINIRIENCLNAQIYSNIQTVFAL